MGRTYQVLVLAVGVLILVGCRRQEQTALPSSLIADGKPAIRVHLEPTYVRVTSKATGANIIPGVDIYAGGGCIVRSFDGTEVESRISEQQLAILLRFFEAERILGLTDTTVDGALTRETVGPGVFSTHQNYTRLVIRQPNVLTYVSRYDLANEIKSHPNCRELQAIQRCVDKIYEIVASK